MIAFVVKVSFNGG